MLRFMSLLALQANTNRNVPCGLLPLGGTSKEALFRWRTVDYSCTGWSDGRAAAVAGVSFLLVCSGSGRSSSCAVCGGGGGS
jgi:hypothetical protein